MALLRLSLACWDYDRTRPLIDGSVRPEGIELIYVPLRMPESFFRMRRFQEFDVSEMSLSGYVRSLESDEPPWIAIPVFPSRVFRHGSIYVNAHAGISSPDDLIGARVGVPEYHMTAAVWIRGILEEYHGVPTSSLSYFTGGLVEPGRVGPPLALPPEVRVSTIPTSRTLSEMLDAGDLDALYTAEPPASFLAASANVRRLFEDYARAEHEYFRTTSIFPIMHTVVIRRSVYEANRWVAQSLFKAFSVAQRWAYDELHETGALKIMLPWLPAHVETTEATFGTTDFWPYGLDRNAETLRTFLRYGRQQHLLTREWAPHELFAPETLERSRS
jgi:4,5-dihydroxyphthalate decarboxylase